MPKPIFQYSTDQLKTISQNFTRELQDAQAGKKNSLAFIKNPLPKHPLIKSGETFQTMVIGGSNFRSALVSKSDSDLTLSSIKESTIPKFKDKHTFAQFFLDHLEDSVSAIAINFAYPLTPTPQGQVLDGTLTTGRKGHAFKDVIGHQVGQLLHDFVHDQTSKSIQVSLANDTICLLLSGLNRASRNQLIGAVVGSGINFALFTDDHTAINLESGNFDKLPQSPTGNTIDNNSLFTGAAVIEKEISGAFLYQHFNLLVDPKDQIKSTDQLSKLSQSDQPNSQPARDLLLRSASLAAAQMAGIYHFKQQEKLTFVTEGSLFWKAHQYQQNIKATLEQLGVPAGAINFIKVTDCDLLGAAHLIA